MKIGTRCKIINATVPQNSGASVIIVGDAGKRQIADYGITQCYFVDRPMQTRNGKYRNWTTEQQLEPIDDLIVEQHKHDFEYA